MKVNDLINDLQIDFELVAIARDKGGQSPTVYLLSDALKIIGHKKVINYVTNYNNKAIIIYIKGDNNI